MSNKQFFGSDKEAREQAKCERKAARRRPVKDGRLGPVQYGVTYGDTGAITTEKEMTNGSGS